ALASALSGAATSLITLAGARALQGAFAALLAPTALSLLALTFVEPRERIRAFGVYGAIAASGGAIGLLLGGLLTQYLDWRWCLYVNGPIALVAAAGVDRLIARPRPTAGTAAGQPFDVLGLVLGSTGLVALVTGCGQAATQGWAAPGVLALLATSLVAFAWFVHHEARSAAPLLPLRVVRERPRGGAYLSALLAIAGMFGAFLLLTYELQVVMGLVPFEA